MLLQALDRPRRFLEFIFDDMLYEGKSGYGYGWVFPKEKLFNVGIAGGTFHLLDRFSTCPGCSATMPASVPVHRRLWPDS